MKKILLIVLVFIFFSLNPALSNDEKETLIILDQSASMLDSYRESSKIDYAIRTIKSLLKNMPDSERVGLRTVGVHPVLMFGLIRKNRNALCEATILLNDIQPNNKSNINKSLLGIIPSGASPLQYTLQVAIDNDFYINTRLKHIILVTDGYENCDGDPCNYIRRIMVSRDDLKIDVIGIGLKSEDRNLLGCLTSETNGTIYDISMNTDIEPITTQLTGSNPTVDLPSQNYNYNFSSTKPKIQKKSYLMEFYE